MITSLASERPAALLLRAGGLSLALKLLVILVTDGESTDTGFAAVFLLLGVVLLVVGFAAFGSWLVRSRPLALRALAAAVGVVLFFVLDTIGKNLVDDSSYWQDEMGILLLALVALALAAVAASRTRTTA